MRTPRFGEVKKVVRGAAVFISMFIVIALTSGPPTAAWAHGTSHTETALDPCGGAEPIAFSPKNQALKPPKDLTIDANDIGGKVIAPDGYDSTGLWVIAEAPIIEVPDSGIVNHRGRLPKFYRKIVVTDENGHFVLPDLPPAVYNVWVRGYGFVDSDKVQIEVGELVTLVAEPARCIQEAAQYYPPNYWVSLFEVPNRNEFPGTGPRENGGNGISENMQHQEQWVMQTKLGCQLCHALGNHATRLSDHLIGSIYDPGHVHDLGEDNMYPVDSGPAAFDRHLRSGQRGAQMSGSMDAFGRERGLEVFGDWAERMAAGEVPRRPPRPEDRERNIVISMWEWGDEVSYPHDEVATDKRNPTVNANGRVWGVEFGNDRMIWVEPDTHEAGMLKIPNLPGNTTTFFPQNMSGGFPSAKWGDEIIWTNPMNPHNPMLDAEGKLWVTVKIRELTDAPEFCATQGTSALPDPTSPAPAFFGVRQLGYYDPDSKEWVLIDTCYGTHHLQFDKKGVLWMSGDLTVVGWFDPAKFDPNDPSTVEEAQGWSTVVVDSNGDGVIDTPMVGFHYGIIPNPADGSVWTGVLALTSGGGLDEVGDEPTISGFPGRIERYDPLTGKHEAFEPPSVADPDLPAGTVTGHGPRGIDVDTNGLIWTALGGSGHLASFDRSKCAQAWGTGRQCPEGWTLYPTPGPQIKNIDHPGSADFHYYNWVDQHDVLGIGKNAPIATGSTSDSLLVLDPETKEWVVARVPYPLGMYSRGLDGRIDDPSAGWKGRGLWATYGSVAAWHIETEMSNIVKFQLRPDPLAH